MPLEEQTITVEVTCMELPTTPEAGLSLGIQEGDNVVEFAPVDQKRIIFRPDFRIRRNPDGSVNFLGPFAQGPKHERFIYLNWGIVRGGALHASPGRVKLHLNHITWTDVEKAFARKKPIKVTVPMTTGKGKLVFASVRPGVAKWEL